MRSGWDKGHSVSAHADAKKLNALPKPNTAGVSKRSRNHQHEVRRFDQQLTAAIHEEELNMDEICDEMKSEEDEAVMQDIENYPMDQSEYPCCCCDSVVFCIVLFFCMNGLD